MQVISRRTLRRAAASLVAFTAACASGRSTGAAQSLPELDGERMLADVRLLSADSLEGRATGTPGGLKARAYVVAAFQRAGLTAFAGGYERAFTTTARGTSPAVPGANVVGYLRGTERPDRYLVVTAHYDHLGVRNGNVYNGADDNASGTAALIALADYFAAHPPRHSIIFAALDAEEVGLQGARAFVESPPVERAALALNVNMDMVSRSARGELYAAGTHHTPALRPIVERVAARSPVKLLIGHDSPSLPAADDWTTQSDHGAFHAARIPFVYFGVEDHPGYHQPSDDFGTITPAFYVAAARTIADFVGEADRTLAAGGPGPS